MVESKGRPPWPGVQYGVELNVEREVDGKKIMTVESYSIVLSKGDAVTAARAASIIAEKHPGSMAAQGKATKFIGATVMSVTFDGGVWAVDLGDEA